jgi:MFS family permease
MTLGMLICTLGMIVQVTAPQRVVILIGAFLGGSAGMLFYLSQAPFMISVTDEKNRDMLFSMSFAMFPFANALGALIAGQFPAWFAGALNQPEGSVAAYRITMLVFTAVNFVALLPLALLHEPRPQLERGASAGGAARSDWREMIRRPITLKLALPNLLTGLGAAMLIPYMNLFFSERHHLSDSALGALFSLSSLITGAACLAGPYLSRHLGSKIRALVVTQAVSIVFLGLLGFSPFLWLAMLGFLVRGALMNMTAPLYSAFAMEQVPTHEQGALNSMKELAWQTGWTIGPAVSGWTQERIGFSPLFIGTGILYVIAIAATWIFFGKKESL